MSNHKPYAANVPGDYYVEDGCCTMCEVPFDMAPDLFGISDDPYIHCYVKRQPETPSELNQMVDAIRAADLQCIRYRGSDRRIQLRLIRNGEGAICDNLLPDLKQSSRPWWKFW